jgi:hypothetical protein
VINGVLVKRGIVGMDNTDHLINFGVCTEGAQAPRQDRLIVQETILLGYSPSGAMATASGNHDGRMKMCLNLSHNPHVACLFEEVKTQYPPLDFGLGLPPAANSARESDMVLTDF